MIGTKKLPQLLAACGESQERTGAEKRKRRKRNQKTKRRESE